MSQPFTATLSLRGVPIAGGYPPLGSGRTQFYITAAVSPNPDYLGEFYLVREGTSYIDRTQFNANPFTAGIPSNRGRDTVKLYVARRVRVGSSSQYPAISPVYTVNLSDFPQGGENLPLTGMTNFTPTQDAHVAQMQNYVASTTSDIPYEQPLVAGFPTGQQTFPNQPKDTISAGSMISPAEQALYALPGGYTTEPPSTAGVQQNSLAALANSVFPSWNGTKNGNNSMNGANVKAGVGIGTALAIAGVALWLLGRKK
jgi:hypothetical protein